MIKRKNSCLSIILILVFISLCVMTTVFYLFGFYFPSRAVSTYGIPDPSLSLYQRISLSARLVLNKENLIVPINTQAQTQDFTVALGESATRVSQRLEEEGFIQNAEAFRYLLLYSGLDTGIQAGDYSLSGAMSAMQIAVMLQDATPAEITFVILPGWRLEEIAEAIPTSGMEFSAEEFLTLVYDPSRFSLPEGINGVASLEGLLPAGSYSISREINAETFIQTVLLNLSVTIPSEIQSAINNRGLTLLQGLTLASMIEREAIHDEEMPLIASVFYNRLHEAMPFESDPTVQYSLGFSVDEQTWWKNPLTWQDLQVNSSYNTYLVNGFPPGPICAPSESAIHAVAFPAETPYLYFRAACDGSGMHQFAISYGEHVNNACP